MKSKEEKPIFFPPKGEEEGEKMGLEGFLFLFFWVHPFQIIKRKDGF